MWLLIGAVLGIAVVLYMIYESLSWPNPQAYYKGKVVILTGASEGIGAELAVALTKLGAKVAISARNEAKLMETAKRCTKDVLVVPTDVSVESQCVNLVTQTVNSWGKIDIVILNAAKSDVIPFSQMEDSVGLIKQTMDINFMQCVYLTKHCVPHLEKTRGIIVPVSSIAGLIGSYGSTGYSASKHAIHGFFKSLALELGNKVSIVILPLPYVNTTTAASNLKPKKEGFGMTVEECVKRMYSVIPTRKRMWIMTWDTWFAVQLSKVAPSLLEKLTMNFYKENFTFLDATKQQAEKKDK